MKDFDEFINYIESLKLYRQSRVKRWQLRDFVFEENDAEHQLFVAQIIIIIIKIFNIPENIGYKALSYGCCHDFVESTEDSLGDVNYMIKEKNPILKQLVKAQEKIAMQKVESFYSSMIDCENNELSNTIVNLADSIEALLYVNREIKFNTVKDEWIEIKQEILSRLLLYWNKLNKLIIYL